MDRKKIAPAGVQPHKSGHGDHESTFRKCLRVHLCQQLEAGARGWGDLAKVQESEVTLIFHLRSGHQLSVEGDFNDFTAYVTSVGGRLFKTATGVDTSEMRGKSHVLAAVKREYGNYPTSVGKVGPNRNFKAIGHRTIYGRRGRMTVESLLIVVLPCLATPDHMCVREYGVAARERGAVVSFETIRSVENSMVLFPQKNEVVQITRIYCSNMTWYCFTERRSYGRGGLEKESTPPGEIARLTFLWCDGEHSPFRRTLTVTKLPLCEVHWHFWRQTA